MGDSVVGGNGTLTGSIWPASREGRLLRSAVLALVGSILLAVSSKVQMPFWPVPMTMQVLVVLVLGMAYGAWLGTATLVLYLIEGVLGLPVFAGTPERGAGLSYMLGPTGGYLLGFVVAAGVVGRLAELGWDRHPLTTAMAMAIGITLIHAFGVARLAALIGYEKAMEVGVVHFLLGDVLKIALAAAVMPLAWRLLGRCRL